MTTLKERIESYKNTVDFKLLNKLPIIICLNGKSSSKITSLINKPYCEKYAECMSATMYKLCQEVEGTIFGYQYNDEIVLVLRNDQSIETKPWFDNRIQKLTSITASMTSILFNKCAEAIELSLTPIFTSQVFTVPTITESINTIIYKQQANFHISTQFACFYELLNRDFNKNTIKEMLFDLSLDEKIQLLKQECNIDFNEYPAPFRRGIACYRTPKMVNEDIMKNKWSINKDLPIFTNDQKFLTNIFKFGYDIIRQ